jgi:hypothetical protein
MKITQQNDDDGKETSHVSQAGENDSLIRKYAWIFVSLSF